MNNGLTVGRIDFGPLTRFTIGLDDMFHDLARLNNNSNHETNYPPYNIIKYSDDAYAIELAVAGFDQSDIEIEVEHNHLTISGNRAEKNAADLTEYVHRGISSRNFTKSFQLGNYIEISDATIKNGMLTVQLNRVIPEALKPRKISITNTEK